MNRIDSDNNFKIILEYTGSRRGTGGRFIRRISELRDDWGWLKSQFSKNAHPRGISDNFEVNTLVNIMKTKEGTIYSGWGRSDRALRSLSEGMVPVFWNFDTHFKVIGYFNMKKDNMELYIP